MINPNGTGKEFHRALVHRKTQKIIVESPSLPLPKLQWDENGKLIKCPLPKYKRAER